MKCICAAAFGVAVPEFFCLALLVVPVPAAPPRIIWSPPYPLPPEWQAKGRDVIYARCINA
ncbi:hypothetical protein FHS85_001733 [Rhodoligotrophos appendicifer]|uniref:hypothetical protein n=1 Tax=Rhodoligotrophos appendicifer TaxID=987056 RepID=UPI001186BFCA|nr:hypothetical protein [Rhodoligotrophos appendicifer]